MANYGSDRGGLMIRKFYEALSELWHSKRFFYARIPISVFTLVFAYHALIPNAWSVKNIISYTFMLWIFVAVVLVMSGIESNK